MSDRRYSRISEPEAESLLQLKLAELKRLEEVESLTSQMASLLLSLNDQITHMQLGSGSVADVTANWIQIVRAVSLAANSMMVYNEEDFKNGLPTTERLVRCTLNELGMIVNEKSKNSSEIVTENNSIDL